MTKIFILLVVCFVPACATSKQEVKKRYFWPPFTDDPKIEYIGFVQTDYDVKKRSIGVFEEVVFGREIPKGLFSQPYDIYSNGAGRFYLSEAVDGYVHVVDLELGKIEQLQNRKGLVNLFKMPLGIDGDRQGNVYVVDSKAKKIEIFGPDNRLVDEWFLNAVTRPINLAVDEPRGLVYVVSPDDHQIHVLSMASGQPVRVMGHRGSEDGEFNFPVDVDVDKDGNVYVLDSLNARVQVFRPDGIFLRTFGERGTALGSFQLPKGIAVSPSGQVYVSDSMAHRLVVFDLEGNYLVTVGGKAPVVDGRISPGGFYLPQGVDVDSNDAIWVVDTLNRMVQHFQYVNDTFLRNNPIMPGQAVVPTE